MRSGVGRWWDFEMENFGEGATGLCSHAINTWEEDDGRADRVRVLRERSARVRCRNISRCALPTREVPLRR
jgi:hypothetical protein